MKYIKTSWRGYEIDSSEFFAALEIEDVPRAIKAFTESPFIEKKFRCTGVLTNIFKAIDLAEREDKNKLESLKVGEKSIDQILERHINGIIESIDSYDKEQQPKNYKDAEFIKTELQKIELQTEPRGRVNSYSRKPIIRAVNSLESSKLTQEELLELSILIHFLIQEFPHLTYQFNKAQVSFYRKEDHPEGSTEYLLSLSGAPIEYCIPWYTSEEWEAVLTSINRKARIRVHELGP